MALERGTRASQWSSQTENWVKFNIPAFLKKIMGC
jgi:hypothetical protein